MILALAIAAVLSARAGSSVRKPAPAPAMDAWRVMQDAQHAVETGSDARFERQWRAVAVRDPSDRRAVLAEAMLALLRYQYERADTLFNQLLRQEHGSSQYTAAAHLGMALWRAIGSGAARADTLLDQARVEALAANDWHTAFEALVNLAKLRDRRAGPKAAMELAKQARAIADHPDDEQLAQLLCMEGTFAEQLGDTTGRAKLFEGIRVARRGGAVRELGACDLLLAQVVERGGYFDIAERRADEAVHLFERAHYTLGLATASQWLGYARLERGEFAPARLDLERAVRAARTTRFTGVEAWARGDLADLYFALGDNAAARDEAERAAELHQAYGDLWGLAVDLQFQGFVAQARGQLDAACAKYAQSVAAFRRAGIAFNAVGVLRLLALSHMSAGRLDSAQHALDEATRLGRASANVGWESELPVHLAHLAMLRGDFHIADSLVALARPRFTATADVADLPVLQFTLIEAQLALREHRMATADSAVTFLSAAITERRRVTTDADLRAGLAQLRAGWGGLSESYPELIAGLAAGGRLNSAFRFIESVRAREITEATLRRIARLNDSSAALAEFRRLTATGASVTLDEARRRMPRDAALVVLTLGTGGAPTTAIIVTSDSAMSVLLPASDVVAPLIERYLRVASTGGEPVAVGRQLGAALLDPIVRVLPARVTRLQISPDGDLVRVPYDALRLADDRYAVERYAISLVPSATAARVFEAMPAATGATTLLAVGDPTFRVGAGLRRRDASTRLAGDSSRFGSVTLARLPRSADEARRIAIYGNPSVVLTRGDATEAGVRGVDWKRVGVAHFATHALVDNEGQARTALALAPAGADDGFLTTSEIASLHLNGPLVVLSACESLGGQILGGEGLRGLTGPLFEAGARAIVVTHWSIGDGSVLPFVDRFYAAMASGESVGDALRHTKLIAIHEGARIADWAAFTVIGDASMHPLLRPRRVAPLDWVHAQPK